MAPRQRQQPDFIESEEEDNSVVEVQTNDFEVQSGNPQTTLLLDALDSWNETGVLLRSVGSLVVQRESNALGRRMRELSEADDEPSSQPPQNKKQRRSNEEGGNDGSIRERLALEERLDLLVQMSSVLVTLHKAHRQFREGLFSLIDA